MQAELIYRKSGMMTCQESSSIDHKNFHNHLIKNDSTKDSRETIHSGHFMISDFEAEAQDDEDELAVPVPEEEAARLAIIAPVGFSLDRFVASSNEKSAQQLSIETSLNKLFQCMSLAYRQKLTSPKWNRFKGIRLRWKDKIRLNNVIWRCWHMQFILKQNTLVCQFASPLDVDTHNKPEAVVLEGKYWKRKLAAVTAEYKKWRMFYRNRILGWTNKDGTDMLESMDMLDWDTGMMGSSMGFGSGLMNVNGNSSGLQGSDSVHNMMVDEDYMELMTDTLFSTISSNQPLYFPDPREIARGASLADFIQPSLGPLQPNLDDFMDTLEPLQEFLNSKLPSVPEEEDIFRTGSLSTNYSDLYLVGTMNNQANHLSSVINQQQQQHHQQRQDNSNDLQNIQYNTPSPNIIYRNTTNNNDNYLDNRDKMTRGGRSLTKEGNRVIQHSPQQQQQQQQQQQHHNFANNISHQIVAYQSPQQILQNQQIQQQNQLLQSTNNYNNLDMQQVQLATSQNIMLSSSQNSSRQIESQTFSSSTQPNTTNQQQIIELTNPFKILTTQQNYKLPQNPSYTAGQFKYHGKNSANQQTSNITNQSTALIAAATTTSTSSSSSTNQNNIILHNNKSGLNSTSPTLNHQRTITTTPPTATTTPPTITTNNLLHTNQDKEEIFAVPKYQMKARSRSRSSSALNQTRNHPPPLVSAISDPSLNINNNVLLAQLLTNNTSGLYTVSNGPDKLMLTQQQNTNITGGGLKKIQPILPSINKTIQLTNPIIIQQQVNNSTNLARVSSNSSSSRSNSSSSSNNSSSSNSTSNNNNSSITNNSDNGNNNANNNCNSINNSNCSSGSSSSSSSSSSSRSSSSGSNKNSVNKTTDTSEKSSMTMKKNCQGQNNNKNVSNDTTTTTTGSTNVHSPQGLNASPLDSPMNIDSPLSPNSHLFIKNDNNERGQYKEQRRVGHIHAEQKRRYNIKNGFDMLHNLIPQLNQNPNAKLSKAAMLQKGADYIRQLRNERNQIKEEMDNLKQQIDNLNLSITNCQSLLPATGAPVLRQRTNKMKEMFDDYVKKRTRENWKFWIFSILLEPLMISFNASVSTASVEDLCRSTILWVEQHCSLVDLRPAVLNSLRYLCTATEILSDPGRLPEEALAAVNQPEKR